MYWRYLLICIVVILIKQCMITVDIYFTNIFVVLGVASITWVLMNSDIRREDLWYTISISSWMLLTLILIGGLITTIWVSPFE